MVAEPTQPLTGGYVSISNPLSDQGVLSVISFLTANFGDVVKSAVLVSAERQVVGGYNYRLTLSLDNTSSAQYVIVVYQNLQQSFSLSSISLVNVKSSYSFGTALSSSEVSALPYISLLNTIISNQLPSLIIAGTVIDSIFKDFPYF